VPRHDPAVELEYLRLQHPQLSAESGHTGACNFQHPLIAGVGDEREKLLHTFASDRRDDARVRWSIRQLCCSGVLVATNRMFGRMTASQIASASAEQDVIRSGACTIGAP